MAKQTVVTITDDLDGTKNATTIRFSYDGTTYELDLSAKNKRALDKALAPYIAAGRKVPAARSGGPGRRVGGRAGTTLDVQSVREWARANGYDVSDRGRVAGSIIDAFNAAN